MWILVRALIALVALAVRAWSIAFPPRQHGEVAGIPSYVRKSMSNRRRVSRLDLGLALEGPVVFRLTREGRADRLFKRIGAWLRAWSNGRAPLSARRPA